MEINLKQAKCTGLSLSAPVQMAMDDDTGNTFLIEAYTGEVVDRWWGMLAIEVAGIHAKKNIPVLMNHNSDQIVGYSTKTYKDGSFFVAGKFSDVMEKAREVKALALEGFPWQASIGVRPIKIMSIEKDGNMQVNGKPLKGPAEVWLESEVFETSFVPLGADGNTSVSTFSKINEQPAPTGVSLNPIKDEIMEFTLENLAKEAPALLASIQADAKKEGAEIERKRIQDVLANTIAGHEALTAQMAFDGKTTGPEAAVQILAAEKLARKTAGDHLAADGVPPVQYSEPPATPPQVDPKTAEAFSAHADLVEEFGDFETYAAYMAANKRGQVRILKNKEK